MIPIIEGMLVEPMIDVRVRWGWKVHKGFQRLVKLISVVVSTRFRRLNGNEKGPRPNKHVDGSGVPHLSWAL